MKIVKIILIAVIALISVAAGLAKVMKVPAEMAFLTGQGLSEMMILIFGALQVLGGLLTAAAQTRLCGAVLVFLGFLLSAVLIFNSGNVMFALVSLVPVVISAWLTLHSGIKAK